MAVVIPTYGADRLPRLRRTLDSLCQVRWPAGVTGVWLVENGPQVGAETVCAEFAQRLPTMHYLHEPCLGLSAARNAGIAASRGNYLIFFDNDVRVGEGTLQAYEQAFRDYGPGCFYGGPVHPEYDTPPPDWLRPYLPPSAVYWHVADTTGPLLEPLLLGGNHAVSRTALRDAGGYDVVSATGNRGGTGEETRLQKRIQAIGGKVIYIADAPVWHYVPEAECTPRWALERRSREALTEALLTDFSGQSHFLGAPRWLWRRWVEASLQCMRARLVGRGLQQRFDLEVRRAYLVGMITGSRARSGARGVVNWAD